MQRLRQALEDLDAMISELEDRIGLQVAVQRESSKKMIDHVKTSRAREAGAMALAQKVAARLDQSICHVEEILGG
jgi:hypothetical protein